MKITIPIASTMNDTIQLRMKMNTMMKNHRTQTPETATVRHFHHPIEMKTLFS